MSYEQLTESVDRLATVNADLKSTVVVVRTTAEASRDAAQAFAIDALGAASEVTGELLAADQVAKAAAEAVLSSKVNVVDLANVADPNKGVSLVPTALGLAVSVASLRSSPKQNQGYFASSPTGNPGAFAQYIKTGIVDLTKAGLSEPPYLYDTLGNEFVEQRPISFQYIPEIVLDESPKLIVESPYTPGQTMIAVCKKDGGYLIYGLANNVTTNSIDSLGTAGNNPTMNRIISVQGAVAIVVGNLGNPTKVGTWVKPSLNEISPEIPAFDNSWSYLYHQTQAVNATLTYSAMVPTDGVIALSFLCSSGSNPAASISIDGVVTTVNLVSTVPKIKTFRFNTNQDTVAVVITNVSAGAFYYTNFLGQNFSTLANWKGAVPDTWGYYRSNAFDDYIISNSENDYTMKEFVTKIYGGGYHGGESNITNVFKVDGVTHVVSSAPKLGRYLAINSTCDISWVAAGSPSKVSVRKDYEFIKGGHYCTVNIKGNIVLAELYSALFGASQTFDLVDAPTPSTIKDVISNNQRLNLGRTSKVVMRNSRTGQKIVVNYTVQQNDSASQYGGVYLWRVDGTYNKLYYSTAHAGRLSIAGHYACNRYEFH